MAWNDDLLPDQRDAVAHVGSHARLIAGPGTGKTYVLTGRVLGLVTEHKIPATEILILTFTRAAAQELRDRAQSALGEQADQPYIATLHSFALRQLLRNSNLIETLPAPLRIADDWEERWLVQEEMKMLLDRSVGEVKEGFHGLSADWESLTEIQPARDPQFIGVWREHREVYGYSLRAELVYELKRALEQVAGFKLDTSLTHLMVDEYQDLNKCDLAIIRSLVEMGLELFVAGDDDQSIYGFRKAHPEGIRRFVTDFPGARDLPLRVCIRCDTRILELALFVAALDPKRLAKELRARDGCDGGAVHLVRFQDQYAEAAGIAKACAYLIASKGYEAQDILVLLRSDRNRAYSQPLIDALGEEGIPVAAPGDDLLDGEDARLVIALLRLCVDKADSLAWRTVLQLRPNRLGPAVFRAVYNIAVAEGVRFANALEAVTVDPSRVPRFGQRLADEVKAILGLIEPALPPKPEPGTTPDPELLLEQVRKGIDHIVREAVPQPELAAPILDHLTNAATLWGATSIAEVLSGIEAARDAMEPAVQRGAVNILTMHRAKGLTAKAVFIAAAEDEMIPGRQEGEEQIGDERRLLYVSLTRAKHFLCISYCAQRVDQQQNLGSRPGNSQRTLTRFLRDAPLRVELGVQFLDTLRPVED